MIRKTFATLLMALLLGSFAGAQVKIGYTDLELVLAYLPAAKSVEQTLYTYQEKLQQGLEIKQKYARTKLEEYAKVKETNAASPEQLAAMETELQKLDKEIADFIAQSEDKILAKREELLGPVLKSLNDAIEAVAKENGYVYVVNNSTGGGTSTILFGPKENDITKLVFQKLNIPFPKEGE